MSNTDKNELTFTVECKRRTQEVTYGGGDRMSIICSSLVRCMMCRSIPWMWNRLNDRAIKPD